MKSLAITEERAHFFHDLYIGYPHTVRKKKVKSTEGVAAVTVHFFVLFWSKFRLKKSAYIMI